MNEHKIIHLGVDACHAHLIKEKGKDGKWVPDTKKYDFRSIPGYMAIEKANPENVDYVPLGYNFVCGFAPKNGAERSRKSLSHVFYKYCMGKTRRPTSPEIRDMVHNNTPLHPHWEQHPAREGILQQVDIYRRHLEALANEPNACYNCIYCWSSANGVFCATAPGEQELLIPRMWCDLTDMELLMDIVMATLENKSKNCDRHNRSTTACRVYTLGDEVE